MTRPTSEARSHGFPASLRYLIRLLFWARIRRLVRNCRSVKGVLACLLGLGLFSLWVSSFFIQRANAEPQPELLRTWAPVGLFGFCLISLFTVKPDQGIPFQPAEIDFLFAGPFCRRDLLVYRIAGNLLNTIPSAVVFSLFLLPHVKWWVCGFVGVLLAVNLIQLAQMATVLLAATIAQQVFSRGRRFFLLAVAVVVVGGVSTVMQRDFEFSLTELVDQFRSSWGGLIVLTPFEVLGRTMGAESIAELAGWALVALGINVLLVAVVIRLDVSFLEASVAATRRLSNRRERARKGRFYAKSEKVNSRRRLPPLPRWGGVGPIAWQQLTTVFRSAGGIIVFVAVITLIVGVPGLVKRWSSLESGVQSPAQAMSLLAPLVMFSVVFLPQMLRFDFRGDVDRLDMLKSLPLPASSVVLGELLAPVVLMAMVQMFFIALIVAMYRELYPWGLLVVAFLPPVNLLIFETENLVFLLYPHRLATAGNLDFQQFAGHLVMMFVKLFFWSACAGVVAVIAAIVYWLTNGSILLTAISAWVVLAGIGIAMVPVLAAAFCRLDPSIDLPP